MEDNYICKSPVLLLLFNRPEAARRLVREIAQVRPAKLYFAFDGPRDYVVGESEKCALVREVVKDVDWECSVETLCREKNLGCALAVSSAITWFFEREECGLIFEDDILVDKSWYAFADELLATYKDDERIGCITALSYPSISLAAFSYGFSRYNFCWGWASWRRAWQAYDHSMGNYDTVRDSVFPAISSNNRYVKSYWSKVYDSVKMESVDSWAYRWSFTFWANDFLAINPNVNMVTNLGIGLDSTHTKSSNSYLKSLQTNEMRFPLTHPIEIKEDKKLEECFESHVYGINFFSYLSWNWPVLFWLNRLFSSFNSYNTVKAGIIRVIMKK